VVCVIGAVLIFRDQGGDVPTGIGEYKTVVTAPEEENHLQEENGPRSGEVDITDQTSTLTPEKPKDKTPVEPKIQQAATVTPTPKPITPKKTTPPPPRIIPAASGPYQVQTGSFGGSNNAEKEASRLKGLGFDARVKMGNTADNSLIYRVRIGYFKSRSEATAFIDLTQWMDTSDEWITERSGIRERRWVELGPDDVALQTGSEMGAAAARMAISEAGIDKDEIDLILYATLSPDVFFPGNGVFIEDLLELNTAGAMDIRNQCTGFVYALAAADGFIRTGTARTVLIVGQEIQSTGLNLTTEGRDLAVLFGDGAGAVLVQACEDDRGVLASVLHSQGRYARELIGEAPMSTHRGRVTAEIMAEGRQFPHMNGQMVFKHATRRFCESIREVLEKGGVEIGDVNLVVPHQANQRITDAVANRMGLSREKVFSNIAKYGNTTAASIPIALAEAVREGRLEQGDLLVTVAFGSGFTWGANLVRW